ncbi:centromere protein C/Mif2/cnp3 [Artemisia annua]|uniref:Centromere protein C/Mif2/cnp3 n=2 Tax=Artemisia annua TaxID=35608 RepID=A0A2U1NJ23_ARTAN|nr:centromere protein C/Mif2/cnp3 [Artemisia annua]
MDIDSTLIDPFKGDSILSLNPKTFRGSKDAANSKDIESIHQFMSAMALQNADKYLEEARSVKDGDSEFPNTKENVNPQEKRPALVRKRAKFSMKPSASHPSTILEPTLQMDQLRELRDPDKFFAAFEKLENAEKEIRRQRGEDPNETKVSTTTTVRQRRPELPRRKTSYKHHVYSSQPESDTSFAQETLQNDVRSPPTFYSQQEPVIANCESQEEDVVGSVTETEDRVDKIFNHLMATCNNDNLDDKGRLSYLEECLNAKPPEITELNLPDFHSIPRVDFGSPVKTLVNQSRLSDTRPLLDNLRGKTPAIQQLSDNRFSPLGSPTPPRSPFFAISTFGKHKSKRSEGKDPFSPHDIDSSHTANSETNSGQSTHTRKYNEFSFRMGSLVDNEVTETAINDVTHTASAEGLSNPPDSDNLSEQFNMEEKEDANIGVDYAATAINENEGIQGKAEDVEKAASGTKINLNVEDITDNGHPRSVQEMEEIVEYVTEKAVPSTSPEADVEISTMEDLNTHCFQSAQTDTNIIKDLNESRPAQNTDIVSQQQNEEQPKKSANTRKKSTRAPKVDVRKTRQSLAGATICQADADIIEDLDEQPKTSVNKRKTTTRASKVDLKKRRQSLAEAGTVWTGGVRKSNRIRRRPLEYWKGERLLYGRVHNSLPTIIGVKYLSPAKEKGKPECFRVESFVSDKYKDLVDLASLH